MKGILDAVNQRTQMVGQNRLEILVFRLMGKQHFGINVFKVKEILNCPKLTYVPNFHPSIRGLASVRGKTVSIIDLSLAIGGQPIVDLENAFVVITEFNRLIQGFLIDKVERIINIKWDQVLPPPAGIGKSNYLTAITELDDKFVQILDVESVLAEIFPSKDELSEKLAIKSADFLKKKSDDRKVLIVDDSQIACKQVKKAVESLGYKTLIASNGREALDLIQMLAQKDDIENQLAMVISDIEMPTMDGYKLTTEIKKNPKLKQLKVILHSSLSGKFNESMVTQIGADAFVSKFVLDEFVETLLDVLKNS